MKLRRTSFLLSGSLLAATLLTSLGFSEPALCQEPQLKSLAQEPTKEPARPSAEVIAAWEKAGAEFSLAAKGVPIFHFRLTPTEKLNVLPPPKVPFGLNLQQTKVTSAGLQELAVLTQLQTLVLGSQVTDAGLKGLAGLKQLQTLDLDGTKVTDAGLKELAGLTQLRMLLLDDTNVTDTGLKELASLTQLRTLRLNSTKVTDEGVRELQESLPRVRISQ
jgi:hypothetical protein